MAYTQGRKPTSGLDNGERPSKKRKRGKEDASSSTKSSDKQPDTSNSGSKAKTAEVPRIQPGERLADFAARVNQALPVSGLARKGKQNIAGTKDRTTRLEKRITRLQEEWRKDEERLVEKEEEERELAEDEEEDRAAEYGQDYREVMMQSGKKGKRKRMIGEQPEKEGDPWAVLKTKREEPKGLHDVAQAPPQFKAIPKEKFKMRNGATAKVADVPSAAGSLRRREELGEERKNIIARYRELMSSKRSSD